MKPPLKSNIQWTDGRVEAEIRNENGRSKFDLSDTGRYLINVPLHSLGAYKSRHHVIVACAPKTGSTYLANILSALPGFNRVVLVPWHGARENEIDVFRLYRFDHLNYVDQLHVKRSGFTEFLRRKFNLKTIVLVRNIFDVIISLVDHFSKEGPIIPLAFLRDSTASFGSEEELVDFIIDLIVPWYAHFHASWYDAADVYRLTYESLISDTFGVVSEVCELFQFPATEKDIRESIKLGSERNFRFNIGRSGRGHERLSVEQKARVTQICRRYNKVDFKALGLVT